MVVGVWGEKRLRIAEAGSGGGSGVGEVGRGKALFFNGTSVWLALLRCFVRQHIDLLFASELVREPYSCQDPIDVILYSIMGSFKPPKLEIVRSSLHTTE